MAIKLIATDMDGTLLNSEKQISERNLLAIRRIMDKGIKFSISTGRPLCGISRFLAQTGANGPSICYNGSVIHEGVTGRVLFRRSLDFESFRRLYKLGNELDTTMTVWSNDVLYGNRLDERLFDYCKYSGIAPRLLEDIDSLYENGVTKLLWYDTEERIAEFKAKADLIKGDMVTSCTSMPFFLEFFDAEASKGLALKKICELYDLRQDEIMAFGDGMNDLDMILFAGRGIAMGNSCDEVKKVADEITLSNDEDGVAAILELL